MPWELDEPISTASWYYADQADVEELIGDLNTGIVFDLDDDGNIDTGAVQRAGEWSDGYINLKLRNAGVDSPNDLTDTDVATVLRSVSAHLAAWYGFHQRGLREAQSGQPTTAISGLMEGYKKFADELLETVIGTLAEEDTDAEPTGVFGFVPIDRECESISDENSQ